MLTRAEIHEFYLQLAAKAGVNMTLSTEQAVAALEPLACRALLRGEDPAVQVDDVAPWTMRLDASADHVRGAAAGVLAQLGLNEMHTVAPTAALAGRIDRGLKLLAERFPEGSALVSRLTSSIAYLKQANGPISFASAAFRDLPHCTLLTALGARHVAPTTIFPAGSEYPLMENLVHEAVHQELYLLIDMGRVFAPAALNPGLPKVLIPWRNTSWDLYKVIHTALVYATCADMRATAFAATTAASPDRDALSQSLASAEQACGVLLPALANFKAVLKPDALTLVDQAWSKVTAIFGSKLVQIA